MRRYHGPQVKPENVAVGGIYAALFANTFMSCPFWAAVFIMGVLFVLEMNRTHGKTERPPDASI